MKRYSKYRDSGIDWIGEIPEHWEVKRNKYIFKEINERSETGLETLLMVSQRYGLVEREEFVERPASSESLIGYKICQVNDLILNKLKAYLGVFFRASISGLVSPDYTVFRAIESVEVDYFEHLFKTPLYISELNRESKGIVIGFFRLYTPDFYNLFSVFPPIKEQKQIVSYIRYKSVEIDQFISNKQKLIELLKEQKTAITNRAVTKGINPHAPMKPSGIDWLGEIPAHWQVKRNKYIFGEINERSETGKETYLAMSQRLGLVERSQLGEQHLSTSENQIGYKLCQVNDLVLNKLKAYLGVFCKASISGLVSPDYTVFRAIVDIEVDYFEHLFKTQAYIAEFNRLSTGIVIGFFRLYTPDFYNIYSLFPPLNEQKEIVQYIKNESLMINEAIAKAEKEIELIQEYRTTLISDAVTGKIDVRETSAVETTLTTAAI